MLRHDADPRTGAALARAESLRSRRGLLSGILESVGDFLGFGNDQAHPSDPKDTATGVPSTPGSHEPTNAKLPVDQPSPPAQVPPSSYPAPGGGAQVYKPTLTALMPPASVSPASSSSVDNAAESALDSTRPPAMNVVPSVPTASPGRESQHVSDIYGGTATSHTVSPGWPSVSSAPYPTHSPSPGAQIGHKNGFSLAAVAAIGAVLGFVIVSALFWAVWLALRKRRRAYPEFASVHPKWVSVPEVDENQFTHPRDEKEDNPFDAASLWRVSTARSLASTLSV